MRRIAGVGFLTIAVTAFCASAAEAQVALDAVGVLDQYCADDQTAPHPKKIIMRQLMTTDKLATFGGTVFASIYDPGRATGRTGMMAVRVRIERADGSLEKLSRTVGPQNDLGHAEVLAHFPVAVREGDTIIWRVVFKRFADMEPGDCFLLIGATMRP